VITFHATVVDHTGAPVSGAIVGLAVSGPSPANLTSGPSGADGIASASWQTRRSGPNRTLPGQYTVTVTSVVLDGAVWDGVPTSTSVTIQ